MRRLRSSIMTGISERQSLTREEKFVALVHIYAELRLPFDAALDAAEADLLREQNKWHERGRTAVANSPLFPLPPYSSVYRNPPGKSLSQLSDEPLVVVV